MNWSWHVLTLDPHPSSDRLKTEVWLERYIKTRQPFGQITLISNIQRRVVSGVSLCQATSPTFYHEACERPEYQTAIAAHVAAEEGDWSEVICWFFSKPLFGEGKPPTNSRVCFCWVSPWEGSFSPFDCLCQIHKAMNILSICKYPIVSMHCLLHW